MSQTQPRRTEGPKTDTDIRHLQLYRPGGGPGLPGESQTLGEFFARCFHAEHLVAERASSRSIEQYNESVSLWEKYTEDPPLRQIDRKICMQFLVALQSRPGRRGECITADTVNKHVGCIRKVLRWAGPVDEARNPMGHGLFDRVPYLQKLPKKHQPPKDGLSIEEIEQWWDAVGTATKPTLPGIEPPDWWRALILFDYNTGFRIKSTLLACHSMMKGDWLHAPGKIMKGGRAMNLYLNTAARAAMDRIRTASDRIFSWPYKIAYVHAIRREVQDRDNHSERENWTPHALRRTILTWLAERNPAVAQLMAGHTGNNVLLNHYVQPYIVKRLVEKMPQPRQAAAWFADDDPQMRLF